eukprot:m.153924 g.153924  ORF g.153924 m.153924 type:complete len:51 (-) comp14358_c0_seq2:1878-2030(-)
MQWMRDFVCVDGARSQSPILSSSFISEFTGENLASAAPSTAGTVPNTRGT